MDTYINSEISFVT